MTTTGEPAFVAATLAWCNERRAEHGDPPLDRLPKGRKGDMNSCPCGEATGLRVLLYHYYATTSEIPDILPPDVVDFIRAFDYGNLPQYDLDLDPMPVGL